MDTAKREQDWQKQKR